MTIEYSGGIVQAISICKLPFGILEIPYDDVIALNMTSYLQLVAVLIITVF